MKLKLITVGKMRNEELLLQCQLYSKRIQPLCPLQILEVKDVPFRKGMNLEVVKSREAEEIYTKLDPNAYWVALDEKGKQKTTEEWRDLFKKWENESRKEIVFLIGGPFGLAESLLRTARERLALSKLTFPHELARVIFLEQLYRVQTLLKGIPYHHP